MIKVLSALGLLLSTYALYVKFRSNDKSYKPLCDINKHISCTKAFTSKYGNIAVLPNPVYGILFYLTFLNLDMLGFTQFLPYMSIAAVVISVYLAYISYIKQRNFCLVCTGIYLVNISLLVVTFQ